MDKFKLKKSKVTPYIIILLLSLIFTLFFFSNLFTMPKGIHEKTLNLSDATVSGDIEIKEDNIFVNSKGGTITFDNIGISTKTLTISTECAYEYIFPASGMARIKDDANSASFTNASTFLVSPAGTENAATISINSKGDSHSIQLEFNESNYNYKVVSAVLNQQQNFHFGWLQFFIIASISIIVYSIIKNRWYHIILDFNNKFHKQILCLSVLFCLIISFSVVHFIGADLFSVGEDLSYNYYYDQFQSFQEGKIEIMIEPDESLENLENPYDISLRNDESVSSKWDLSYYNGKYYFYFGLTPIFIVYYPIYWLTGQVPSALLVCTILSMGATLAITGALWEFLKKFNIHPNLLLYLLVNIALIFGCLLFACQASPSMYTIALISSILFLSLFFYLSLLAVREDDKVIRSILFVLSGVCLVLLLGSRPNYIIIAIAGVTPLFLEVLFDKNTRVAYRMRDACLFLVPVIIGFIGVMYYNYIRFDSPFDFGTAYQITVSDIRYNTLLLSPVYFGEMIYSYFLMPFNRSFEFPFISLNNSSIATHGNYLFQFPSTGIMNIPLYWFSLITGKVTNKKQHVKTAILWLLIGASIIVGYINFCLGGVIYRYACDLMIPLGLVSAIVILSIFSGKRANNGGWLYGTACIICLITIVIGGLSIFSNEPNEIYNHNTDLYISISNLFRLG